MNSCCICSIVKNGAQYLERVLQNMEQIGSIFDDYVIIICYDDSTDNTLQILKDYVDKNSRFRLLMSILQIISILL
jgi:glycosyltransferase involved in cell wall biosynthesis